MDYEHSPKKLIKKANAIRARIERADAALKGVDAKLNHWRAKRKFWSAIKQDAEDRLELLEQGQLDLIEGKRS